jgi:hypothetical protein
VQLLWERNEKLQQRTWNGPKRMLLDIGHIVVDVWLLLLVVLVAAVVSAVGHELIGSDFGVAAAVVLVGNYCNVDVVDD